MSSNIYRLSTRDRETQRQERSKPANTRRHPTQRQLRRMKHFKVWLALVLLFPLGLITALTFGEMLWRAMCRLDFWRSEQFVFFHLGGLAWAAAYATGWRPVRAYVLGHELSHLLVAKAYGGQIFGWKVTAQGGYVETNITNTLITLAPYLVPFYSAVVLIIFGVVGVKVNLQEMCAIPLGAQALHLRPAWIFYAALGLTWWFHATFTFKTVLAKQGDLEWNGEFFSMLLIFLINVLLLVALFLAASPAPGLGWLEVGRCWTGTAAAVWQFCFGTFW